MRHRLVVGWHVCPNNVPVLPPRRDCETYHIWTIVCCAFNLSPVPISPDYSDSAHVPDIYFRCPYLVARNVVHADPKGQICLLYDANPDIALLY